MSEEHVPEGTAEIESLLADRDRLQGWLDRLNQSGGSAPPTVRERVRADYEGRLAEVVARLSGFITALEASLAAVRSQLAHLGDLRIEAEEARAEASLRHGVGEYRDDEWQRLEAEATGKIDGLAADIDRLEDEAAKLEDVLSQVAPPEPEPMAEAPTATRAPGDDVEVEVIEAEEVSLMSHAPPAGEEDIVEYAEAGEQGPIRSMPVEAPRFTPKGGGIDRPMRDRPARTLRFPTPAPEPATTSSVDEMTFLKSVSLETQAAQDRAAEAKAGTRSGRAGNAAAKTLKCTDCGAMNRPTEWYCERCGAELAAL
jgi:hypothetical protein